MSFSTACRTIEHFFTPLTFHICIIPACQAETEVVCYCSLGYRSSVLAARLPSLLPGLPPARVYNLSGSIFQVVF